MPGTIYVVIRDDPLRGAIAALLTAQRVGPVAPVADLYRAVPGRECHVLVVSSECTPHVCGYLRAGMGLHIGVLATIPTDREQRAYEESGATYIPLALDRSTLIASLRSFIGPAAP